MEIFGSYLDKKKRITGEAVNIVLLDTIVALMAGFIIIPACFAFGVQPDSGPSLLFITLPNLFNSMKGGRIWGTLFFIFMSFAALSTIIAVFENIIAMFMDMCSWSRKKSVAVNFVLITVPFYHFCMNCRFTDTKFFCRLPHRRIVVYDVICN